MVEKAPGVDIESKNCLLSKLNGRQEMARRSFLKQVSLWSAGLLLLPPVFDAIGYARAGESVDQGRKGENGYGKTSEILVVKGRDYPGMTRRLVSEAGGMGEFVRKGDKVVIKPNIGWDRTVEQGANTHPEIVAALAVMALESGASKIMVFDRTCNEARLCYRNSGIKQAIDKIGSRQVKCSYIDDRKFIPVKIKKGKALKEWPFYRDALEADSYINVPVAKHHSSSGLSLGLKNAMGVIGGWRGRLHYDLSAKIADLNLVIRPTLTLVDATRVIIRNGPSGGSLSDVKVLDTMVASRDPVAADAYATTLFGLEPQELESTNRAFELGLGQMDLTRCSIREFIV